MSEHEPKRLFEAGEPTALRAALREARAALGGDEEVARLWHKLGALPELAASGSAGTHALGTAGWSRVVLHVCLLAVTSGALIAGWRALTVRSEVTQVAKTVPVMESAAVVAVEEPASSAPQASAPAPPTPERARAAPPRKKVARAAALPAPSISAELTLLREAQDKLELAPQRALALLEQHAREHPSGDFALERESLVVDVLRKLGRATAARERALRFVNRFPNAPQARSMRAWLEENARFDHKGGAPALPTP